MFHRLATCLVAVALCGPAQAVTPYSITALNKLPGTLESRAFGLNDVGQVVGDSRLDRSGNIGQARPVIWDASSGGSEFINPVELWSDPQIGGSAADINNSGVVVGRYGSGSGTPLPGPGVPFGRGFVWDSVNGRQDIGLEPVGNTQAVSINDAGQVVGTSEVLTDIGGTNFFIPRAFIWDEVIGVQEVGDLGGNFSFATDINSQGQVVGYGDNPAGSERGFVWDATNGIQELPSLAGGEVRAMAINDNGQVLGFEFGTGAFIWDAINGTQPIPIGGIDINNLTQVIGGAVSDPEIWESSSGIQSLEALIPMGSGWNLEQVFALNNPSRIVGFGQIEGETLGYLLVPVPEPSSAILALLTVFLSIGRYSVLR